VFGSKIWHRGGIVSGRPLRADRRRPSVGVERLEQRVALSSFTPYGPALPTGPDPQLVASGTFYAGGQPRTFLVAVYDADRENEKESFQGGVSIYLDDGTGQFTAPHDLMRPLPLLGSDGAQPEGVATGRFTNSGFDDIAVADHHNRVFIFRANGDGTFGKPKKLQGVPSPANGQDSKLDPTWLSSAKIDGIPSLIVSLYGYGPHSSSLLIYHQNRSGNLGRPEVIRSVGQPNQVVVANFNKDTHDDLAVAHDGNNSVTIIPGKGNGRFGKGQEEPLSPPAPGDPTVPAEKTIGLAVADFDNDGRLDLAVTTNGGIRFLKNVSPPKGRISFTQPPGDEKIDLPGELLISIVAVDLGNGLRDLVVARNTAGKVSIIRNQGGFAFDSPMAFENIFDDNPARGGPVGLITADLTRDGSPPGVSLVLTSGSDDRIHVFFPKP
jgi:hypothetical protein